MKRFVCIILSIMLAFGTGAVFAQNGGTERVKICILKYIGHLALDEAYKGVIASLDDGGWGSERADIDYFVADGNMAELAQKVSDVKDETDLFIAISTPGAMQADLLTEGIPIVAAAASDPISAGLVESMEAPGGDVTGISNEVPASEQVGLMLELVPNAEKAAIVYSEEIDYLMFNPENTAAAFRAEGVEPVLVPIKDYADASAVLADSMAGVDAVYAMEGVDLKAVSEAALAAGIPMICPSGEAAESVGTVGYNVNYYALGLKAGEMAVRILNGEVSRAGEIPYKVPSKSELELTVNWENLTKLGITLTEERQSTLPLDVIGDASVKVTLNGSPVEMSAPAYIVNGTTMVPAGIFNRLGADVLVHKKVGRTDIFTTEVEFAMIVKNDIKLLLGGFSMYKINCKSLSELEAAAENGSIMSEAEEQILAIQPFYEDGILYLPLRAVCEALGFGVEWNNETATADITGDAAFINDKNKDKSFHELHSPYIEERKEIIVLKLKNSDFYKNTESATIFVESFLTKKGYAYSVMDYDNYGETIAIYYPADGDIKELINEVNALLLKQFSSGEIILEVYDGDYDELFPQRLAADRKYTAPSE